MFKSEFGGVIPFKEIDIEVAILDDGAQVVNEVSLKKMLYNYKNVVDTNIKTITYQNKKGKSVECFKIEDFYTLCMDYVTAKKARQSSIDLAKKILDFFSHFGGVDMINEVTGFNMRKKIEERETLVNVFKGKEDTELSDFNKKLKKALDFKPDNKVK